MKHVYKQLLAIGGIAAAISLTTPATAQTDPRALARGVIPGNSVELKAELPIKIKNLLNNIATAPKVSLVPECNLITFFDNITKKNVTKQDNRVRFKMTVTGAAPVGLHVLDPDNSSYVPFVNGAFSPAFTPAGYLEFVVIQSGNVVSFPSGLTVNGQYFPSGTTPYIVWDWPTGKNAWLLNRWTLNRCNNVPVPPLVAKDAIKITDLVNSSAMLAE